MRYITTIFDRRVKRPVLRPGPCRTLTAQAHQKAPGTTGEIVRVLGLPRPDLREKDGEGVLQGALSQIVICLRNLEEKTGRKKAVGVDVTPAVPGSAGKKPAPGGSHESLTESPHLLKECGFVSDQDLQPLFGR